ncbi:MAG TPA: glycosyltransferase [Candidatus Binatia bacterium]|nr:glycosyltransferase [Candidatus Binatia bacterium]
MRREPIAMVTHSYYEEDPRVRREAEALVAAGHPVDVFALRRRGTAARDEIAGVHVERLDVERHQGAGIPTYLAEYAAFFARAALALARAHRRRRYGLVQVHSLPDPLVFAALPLRLAGVPVLLDLHEAMPEFFRIRFPGAANPVVHGLLLGAERASIAAADAVVTVNEALAERLVGRGVDPAKVAIVRNAPALARFDPAVHPPRSFAEDGLLRLVYAGALSPVYELDCALEAVARLRPALAERGLGLRFDVYGRDYGEVPLAARVAELGLDGLVAFHGRIPIEAVPAAIAAADIGLAPTRRTAFTDFSLSTKLFEYAAMGKPVVASALPMVERTFPPDTIARYEPGDSADLTAAILRLVDDPIERSARVERTMARVRELAWEREAERYVALVEDLIERRRPSTATAAKRSGGAP